ncbi:hypothetical protein WN944_016665 [Citrus x changshan-huyou]|uniref:AB hydrolase-1 domain-containing protein n=1 Tax=Citrus x changshan-huyou TaxID=2935761 RepID=A0AAP0MC27_9ROSI
MLLHKIRQWSGIQRRLYPEPEDLKIKEDKIHSSMMSHFVMVHGASHGAWSWFKVRALLETSGYKVTCLDLKSAGIDRTDPNTVFTLEEYNKPLINLLHNLPHNEKVILVGHSIGGLNVTDAINRFGYGKIHTAVYVAADMSDRRTEDVKVLFPASINQGAAQNGISPDMFELEYALGPDKFPTSIMVKKEYQRELYYHMSPVEDSTLASMVLKPAPARVFACAPFEGGPPDAAKVRRVYIRTLNDHLFKLENQDAMIAKCNPSQIFNIDSEHCPFFSNPLVLSGLLVQLAASIN